MSDPREPFESIRPLLVDSSVLESATGARVRVALEYNSELYVGEADVEAGGEAGGGPQATARAAVRATLSALELLTPDAVAFTLEWTRLLPTDDGFPPVVAAMVGVEVAGVPMRYAGAAVVKSDGHSGAEDVSADASATAAARAALDAVNRRLGVAGL